MENRSYQSNAEEVEQEEAQENDEEIVEYLEAARELESARKLEEAEFIGDSDEEEKDDLEEEISSETQEAPIQLIDDAAARRSYWQAQALVDLERAEFDSATAQGVVAHQRSAY